jgi:hypothetical protein
MTVTTQEMHEVAGLTVWGITVGEHLEELLEEPVPYHAEVAYEDSDIIIFRDRSGEGIKNWASDLDRPREYIRNTFLNIAGTKMRPMPADAFPNSDPIVYLKPGASLTV